MTKWKVFRILVAIVIIAFVWSSYLNLISNGSNSSTLRYFRFSLVFSITFCVLVLIWDLWNTDNGNA